MFAKGLCAVQPVYSVFRSAKTAVSHPSCWVRKLYYVIFQIWFFSPVERAFHSFSNQWMWGSHRPNLGIRIRNCWELFRCPRTPHHADMGLAEIHLNMTRRWWGIESSYTPSRFQDKLVTVNQLDGVTPGFQTICWQFKKYNISTTFQQHPSCSSWLELYHIGSRGQ